MELGSHGVAGGVDHLGAEGVLLGVCGEEFVFRCFNGYGFGSADEEFLVVMMVTEFGVAEVVIWVLADSFGHRRGKLVRFKLDAIGELRVWQGVLVRQVFGGVTCWLEVLDYTVFDRSFNGKVDG